MAPWVSFSGKDCSGCKHLNERGYCEFTACIIPCTVRATIPEVKPITNGDRIRAMSDEELAELLTAYKCVDCVLFSRDCKVEETLGSGKTCEERILDWLKQEVNSGNVSYL